MSVICRKLLPIIDHSLSMRLHNYKLNIPKNICGNLPVCCVSSSFHGTTNFSYKSNKENIVQLYKSPLMSRYRTLSEITSSLRNIQSTKTEHYSDSLVPQSTGQHEMQKVYGSAEQSYNVIIKMNPREILNLVESSISQLNRYQVTLCVKQIHKTVSDLDTHERDEYCNFLEQSSQFQVLCQYLAKAAPHQQAEVVKDLIHCLVHLGVNSNHKTMQTLLQLTKFHIDSLLLPDLISLMYDISLLDPTYQTKILKDAANILLSDQAALKHSLTCLKTWHKVMLLFLFGGDLPESSVDAIIYNVRKEESDIGFRLSIVILQALEKCQLDNYSLVEMCLSKIEPCLHYVTTDEAFHIVKSLMNMDYYLPDVWNRLTEIAYENLWTLEEKIDLLSFLCSQNHINTVFLQKIIADVDFNIVAATISMQDAKILLNAACLLPPYSIPEQQRLAEHVLNSLTNLSQELSRDELLELICCCVALDDGLSIDSSLLHFVVGHWEFLDYDMKSVNHLPLSTQLLLVYQHGNTNLPQRLKSILEKNQLDIMSRKSVVKGAIEHVTEDNWEVTHNFITKTGLFVDHLVHIQKDKRFCDHGSCGRQNVIRQKLSPTKNNVAVLSLAEDCFGRNTGQPTALTHMYARRLQYEGFNVLLINNSSFHKITESDKLAYIKDRIQNSDVFQDLVLMGVDCL